MRNAPWMPACTAFLYRHPCAVALSYKERRWTALDLERRFGVKETGDFWYDHGVLQAKLLQPVLDEADNITRLVSYEKLTQDPKTEFEQLAADLGLEWSRDSREYLDSTLADVARSDPFALTRNATAARDRWMTKLSEPQKKAVLKGYRKYARRGLPRPTLTGYRSRRLDLTY